MRKKILFFALLLLVSSNTKAYHATYKQEVIIQLTEKTDLESFLEQAPIQHLRFQHIQTLSERFNIHLFEWNPNNTTSGLSILVRHPMIAAIQENAEIEFRKTPNDENFPLQWGLEFIGLDKFWETNTGGMTENGDTIVVAVLDEGFDISHEDLSENVWINRAEIPDDDIDNDNNGYVDDIHGWNFIENTPRHAISQHGQSVAGIIGARGNNGIGVTGINWNIKLMLFTILSVSDIIAAYDYIIEQRDLYNQSFGTEGAFVVATNASFGSNGQFCEEQPIWGGMYDRMGRVGVLTGAGTANGNWDVDLVGDMPTTCPSDFIITTLNINQDGQKHAGSAFGSISIDIGSPGENSYTTKPFDLYGAFGKNSAAAPHLTGVIGLLYSVPCQQFAKDALVNPMETALYVRNVILEGVRRQESLKGITVTGGSLDIANSLDIVDADCNSTIGELQIKKIFPNPSRGQITFDYQAAGFDEHTLRIVNILGQVVREESFVPPMFGRKRITLDLNLQTPGTYILVLQRGQELITEKFILF